MQADLQRVQLGAFLHDIGKFAQRARVPLVEGYRAFDRSDYGQHGAHALHSAQFVEQELAPALRGCGATVLYHHNPQDVRTRIVAIADRLSAGERLADGPVDEGPLQPLNSTLATLFAGPDAKPAAGYFSLRRLDLSSRESFFPSTRRPEILHQRSDYGDLWNAFLVAHRRLDQSDYDRYLAGLYVLLQQYTWCIPSAAYHSVPDISLFDHSRTTAAMFPRRS